MVSILGANSVSGGYEVSNSLRFNDDDDARLTRSVSGNLSKAHTFALWIKRANLKASGRHILAAMGDGSGDISWLELNNDRIAMLFDGAGNYFPKTDAVLRDPSAWYHIVVTVDSAQGTASNRCKFYLNGTQLTDTSGTNPPQDHQAAMDACTIGYNSGDEFDGYMAEFHFLDGVAYDPTYFGEFNDNGVWIPKKYTGGNYGTNGFYFEFKQTGTSQNSSGIGADTSGNDNHFAVTNLAATDITTDTCTNNFATLNSIIPLSATATFSQGNLKFDGSAFRSPRATQGISDGKFYFEVLSSDPSSTDVHVGIATDIETGLDTWVGSTSAGYVYTGQTGQKYNNNSGSSYGASFTDGDIIGCAIDMDNGTLSFYKNNSSQGQAYSGLSGTVFPVISGTDIVVNFGQEGSFAGNKTAQGNSDANGYGDFYYSPPSGYYALNTKNLAEFG